MKELILLGRGPSWKECPFDVEVWATSTVLLDPKVEPTLLSKVFAFDDFTKEGIRKSVGLAKELSIPVVSFHDFATEKYPLAEITSHFNSRYLRNTISYMLALSIYQGYEKLRLYGVDQGPAWDYLSTKPYVTFWLGVALGRGIQYELARSTMLLEPFIKEIKANVSRIERVKGDTYKLHILPQLNILPGDNRK